MRKNLALIAGLGALMSAGSEYQIVDDRIPMSVGDHPRAYRHGSPMKYGQKPNKKKTARYHKRKAKYKRIAKMKNAR
jgi:hypothetical protein